MTHISDPNSSTLFTTALKNIPEVFVSTPPQTRMCNTPIHVLRAFLRLATTFWLVIIIGQKQPSKILGGYNFGKVLVLCM